MLKRARLTTMIQSLPNEDKSAPDVQSENTKELFYWAVGRIILGQRLYVDVLTAIESKAEPKFYAKVKCFEILQECKAFFKSDK